MKSKIAQYMKSKITHQVLYINRHINDKYDFRMCMWIADYLGSSYMYEKKDADGNWIKIQPGWPGVWVREFRVYSDKAKACAHRTQRLVAVLNDNSEVEMSLYKFKKYVRGAYKESRRR